jgi:hypothetical protein
VWYYYATHQEVVGEHEMGLGCQHFVEGRNLILVAIYDWNFLKVYF